MTDHDPLAEAFDAVGEGKVTPDRIRSALDAAGYEVRPQKAGACCDEPTLVCTTCGDAHVHGDPRPDHERLAGAWHVWLAEKERIEAEAVAAERQRIKAAVEAARDGYADTDGSRQPTLVERRAVLAIIEGEAT